MLVSRMEKRIPEIAAARGVFNRARIGGESCAISCIIACAGLGALGIALDDRKNEEASSGIREIQRENSRVKVLVIPTDEELEIARQTIETIRRKGGERARGAGY